jgi:NAD(P)-dependent dehydrogenase (short-subunit alcohol dehydrogenase family)
MRLKGKVAIVTGAGIGEAIARHYAREGARVEIAEIDSVRERRLRTPSARMEARQLSYQPSATGRCYSDLHTVESGVSRLPVTAASRSNAFTFQRFVPALQLSVRLMIVVG